MPNLEEIKTYFMQFPSRLTLISFLLLTLIGCENGCTIRRVLDSEYEDMGTGKDRVRVTMNLIDYRNSRAINHDIFNRRITHSYGIDATIRYRGVESEVLFAQGVNDPDNVDLTAELKRVTIKQSKNENHIAVGVDGSVVAIQHFYKNQPANLRIFKAMDAQLSKRMKKVNLNRYPSMYKAVFAEINETCLDDAGSSAAVFQFLDELKPADYLQQQMLQRWPSCELAQNYFTEKRISDLRKDKKWLSMAENRCLAVMENNEKPTNFYNVAVFYEALNSPVIFSKFDENLIEQWLKEPAREDQENIVNRLLDKKRPLSASNRQKVLNKAQSELKLFLKTWENNHRYEPENMVKICLVAGDYATADLFISKAMSKHHDFVTFDIIDALYENFSFFTAKHQAMIRQKSNTFFMALKDYERDYCFGKAKGVLDCTTLKSWKSTYANDLTFSELPEGCK